MRRGMQVRVGRRVGAAMGRQMPTSGSHGIGRMHAGGTMCGAQIVLIGRGRERARADHGSPHRVSEREHEREQHQQQDAGLLHDLESSAGRGKRSGDACLGLRLGA